MQPSLTSGNSSCATRSQPQVGNKWHLQYIMYYEIYCICLDTTSIFSCSGKNNFLRVPHLYLHWQVVAFLPVLFWDHKYCNYSVPRGVNCRLMTSGTCFTTPFQLCKLGTARLWRQSRPFIWNITSISLVTTRHNYRIELGINGERTRAAILS